MSEAPRLWLYARALFCLWLSLLSFSLVCLVGLWIAAWSAGTAEAGWDAITGKYVQRGNKGPWARDNRLQMLFHCQLFSALLSGSFGSLLILNDRLPMKSQVAVTAGVVLSFLLVVTGCFHLAAIE